MGDFSYRALKDGRVLVHWRNRHVTTLAGERAAAFVAQADHLDSDALQQLMARVTGNFKRGNEPRRR